MVNKLNYTVINSSDFVATVDSVNVPVVAGVFTFVPTKMTSDIVVTYHGLFMVNGSQFHTPSTQGLVAAKVVKVSFSGCTGSVDLTFGS